MGTKGLGADQLHHDHDVPARGLRASQYVYAIGSYHYNWHTALELLAVVSGEVDVCAAGKVDLLAPGDVVVINANDGHATLATQPGTAVMCLHVEADYLASFTGDGAIPRFECRSAAATRGEPGFVRLRALLARMMLAAHRTGPGASASWEARLLDVVATLFDHFPPEPAAAGAPELPAAIENHRALRRAVAYIDASFRERITLERLARHVGFSPGYLSQVFSQQVGMTFSEYLARVRLRQATRDLGETDRRIAAIAADAGFPDVKAFNTAFRRTFGRTPSAYRRLLTAETAAADEVFHRRYISRADEGVMRVLRAWASRDVVGGIHEPCTTAARLSRPSPAEEALDLTRSLTARLEEMVDTGAR
ncbi:AraC family transcriptional regulator [Actinomyces sp. oral taxon 448]|jgi:hypothetical protein|uniref:AraC family transcriptional regulator n=1 Tax=Actinomyces sp. oral taxon 448 TaxID=712124 RepID=UPI00021886B2|nr:helix-turn-helix domain-containing protein [Actinomyces sp. oral taxon 448]EGQ75153.1 transcription regulator [Actinomyces sp. oral taxon 448 str. F0400]